MVKVKSKPIETKCRKRRGSLIIVITLPLLVLTGYAIKDVIVQLQLYLSRIEFKRTQYAIADLVSFITQIENERGYSSLYVSTGSHDINISNSMRKHRESSDIFTAAIVGNNDLPIDVRNNISATYNATVFGIRLAIDDNQHLSFTQLLQPYTNFIRTIKHHVIKLNSDRPIKCVELKNIAYIYMDLIIVEDNTELSRLYGSNYLAHGDMHGTILHEFIGLVMSASDTLDKILMYNPDMAALFKQLQIEYNETLTKIERTTAQMANMIRFNGGKRNGDIKKAIAYYDDMAACIRMVNELQLMAVDNILTSIGTLNRWTMSVLAIDSAILIVVIIVSLLLAVKYYNNYERMYNMYESQLRQATNADRCLRREKFNAELFFNNVYPKLTYINSHCTCPAKNQSDVTQLLDRMLTSSWSMRRNQ